MKTKIIILIFIITILMIGCNDNQHIVSEQTIPNSISENNYPKNTEDKFIPLNFTNQKAIWFPYMRFEDILYEKSESEYRSAISNIFSEACNKEINTVYFHVHPNGDSYYKSDLFPRGKYWNGNYDPLSIALEEAHLQGISLHAWINPFRMQTADEMRELNPKYIFKKWADKPEEGHINIVENRWYLIPSSNEVNELLILMVKEILSNYDVDGIHIDDYFYPTTSTSFDSIDYSKSCNQNIKEWRRNNISTIIKSLCYTTHSYSNRLKFGISPQGNIANDMENLYADVELWGSNKTFCDYIVPQIYYGFENETCPFKPTLSQWEELTKNSEVDLIIGLAEFKIGKEDKWAGEKGRNEWIKSPDIIKNQIDIVESSTAKGYALYY